MYDLLISFCKLYTKCYTIRLWIANVLQLSCVSTKCLPFQTLYFHAPNHASKASASCIVCEPEVDAIAMGLDDKVGWIYVHTFKVHH